MNLSEKIIMDISRISKESPDLYYYSPEEIQQLWQQGRILLRPNEIEPEGFVLKIPVIDGWSEITGLYVFPNKRQHTLRRKGITQSLWEACVERCAPGEHVLAYTHHAGMVRVGSRLGFKRVNYFEIPFRVQCALLLEKFRTRRRLLDFLISLPKEHKIAALLYSIPKNNELTSN